MSDPKKILIIDDSLLVRNIIGDFISGESDLKVIATGKTGIECVELAKKLHPDLIILDIEMPVMDGLTALDEMKKLKLEIPVIVLSVLAQHGAEATFKALEKGAIDFVPKPSSQIQMDPKELGKILIAKIRGYFEGLSEARKKTLDLSQKSTSVKNKSFQKKDPIEAICIGTSTGGPKALQTVLTGFPKDFPLPIFVVQHMPAGFTKAFAERVNSVAKLDVKEAENKDRVLPGTVYIAPGDYHLLLDQQGGQVYTVLDHSAPVNGHRPSIQCLFDSARKVYKSRHILAVIMTGMGRDGADSTKMIRDEGGITIAQDEKTSVIYGMNRQAIELGGIDHILPLEEITGTILELVKQRG